MPRRLNDAGRTTGSALAIAMLYALAIVLLMLLVEQLLAPDTNAAGAGAAQQLFGLWVFLLIIVVLSGWSDFGIFTYLPWARLC